VTLLTNFFRYLTSKGYLLRLLYLLPRSGGVSAHVAIQISGLFINSSNLPYFAMQIAVQIYHTIHGQLF